MARTILAFTEALQLKRYALYNPNAVVQLLETGHFATETQVEEIASAMRQFLATTAG